MKQRASHIELFLSHRSALVDYAAPIVGRASAEDVVQEAFIRFNALGQDDKSSDAIGNPVGYLYRIVRNLALDWARRLAPEAPLPKALLEKLPTRAGNAEQILVFRDELRVLAAALAELPERTRIAFDMHRLDGRSLKEVAEHLDISIVRAHQLVKEAILHGTKRLDESGR